MMMMIITMTMVNFFSEDYDDANGDYCTFVSSRNPRLRAGCTMSPHLRI